MHAGRARTSQPRHARLLGSHPGGPSVPLVVVRNAQQEQAATKAEEAAAAGSNGSTNGATPEAAAAPAGAAATNGAAAAGDDGKKDGKEPPAHLSWELNVDELGQLQYRPQTGERAYCSGAGGPPCRGGAAARHA